MVMTGGCASCRRERPHSAKEAIKPAWQVDMLPSTEIQKQENIRLL